MAITNQNVENVRFLRNGSVFTPSVDPAKTAREVALAAMEEQKDNLADGVAILGRYQETSGTVKTLVGFAYISGETKTLTIFDVDGASADVNALREEINAKLGGGITSANTATAQLAALSGGTFTPGTSSSADTSVEGAKAYAKYYTDEQIGGLEYTGVTTGDGKVIVNVTEADGVVSGVTAEVGGLKLTDYSKGSDSGTVASTDTINQAVAKLENQIDAEKDARAAAISGLDYSDSAVAKNFVIEVDETDGVISVTRGSITSSAETIVLSDNADGGVNFEVNIDNDTIVQDSTSKKLKVASAALTQYIGDGKTIQISAADANNNKTVSTLLTLSSVTPSSTTVKEEYALQNASGETIGSTIKIYKDSSLVSITYITDPSDEHYQNLEYVYVDNSGNTQTEYVDMSTLVLEAEFASGVTADASGVVHGVVDSTSEVDSENSPFLTVGADGFKIDGIKDEIEAQLNTVVEGLDATVTGATSGSHITISIEELDGKLVQSGLTIQEDNIADADDLAELSGKAVTEIASSNASISATSAATADDTVAYDLVTDASKIKMSGFTADTSGFTAITEASTITEAVKAIETEVVANELVVSTALNDLNDRVDTVSGDVNTLKTNYISGVSVNGSATTVTDHVAGFNITSSSAATTASTSNAIVVQTDEHGNITLGLNYIDAGLY